MIRLALARRASAGSAGSVALVAVVVAAAVGACDGDADRGAAASRQVHAVLADRFDDPDAVDVDCPGDVELEPHVTVTCAVSVDGSDAEPVELDVDDEGVLVLASAVVPTDDLEAYLVEELTTSAEGPVEATCGSAPLLVGAVGATFPCDVQRSSDGAAFAVSVEVVTVDGQVTYDVTPVAATTTTAPTTSTTLGSLPTVPPD